MRFNELIAGVRSDVAVKVFGDKMEVMEETAGQIEDVLKQVPGAVDVKLEQTTGLPVLTIAIDRPMIARYGLNIADVQEGHRDRHRRQRSRTNVRGRPALRHLVRLPEKLRTDLDASNACPSRCHKKLGTAKTHPHRLPAKEQRRHVPTLSRSATGRVHPRARPEPNQPRERQTPRRRHRQRARARHRFSFVGEAQKRIAEEVTVQPGYWISLGRQFEHLISASQRLQDRRAGRAAAHSSCCCSAPSVPSRTRCWSSPACPWP
jgi:cobalt-zinc-cadmium resistance protein CzcA